MRLHFDDDHPSDALRRVIEIMNFLCVAMNNKGPDDMDVEACDGLNNILLACTSSLRYAREQIEKTIIRAA
jgi:hypothetical protein